MIKTIEEAAREYAALADKKVEELYGIEQPASLTFGECAAESFLVGANYALSLPLSQRLTDEERERVRKEYAEAQSWLDEKPTLDGCNSHLRICAVAIQSCLESIFGKELFEENETKNNTDKS